ncbi:hypothetical protein ABT039_41875 [Streptomyces lasiicapitis]|uniref:hypothetical protein n=1 Tax=Streptomyces lasiicapitis TaxID=1923961 RepID=UPI0033337D3C
MEGQQGSAEVFLPVTVTITVEVAEQGGFGLFRAQDGIGIGLFGVLVMSACLPVLLVFVRAPRRGEFGPTRMVSAADRRELSAISPGIVRDR